MLCLSLKPVSFISLNYKPGNVIYDYVICRKKGYPFSFFSSSSTTCLRFVCSVEKDQSQHYEVDPDKAREALKQLDQQLQSLSQKQVRSPKIKASDVKLTARGDEATEEVTAFSGSFLAYTAGALLLLTIFYNVLFYAVIKPAIDGPEEAPTTAIEREITK